MTKKEAILINSIINSNNDNQNKLKMISIITQRDYQKAKMSMSKEQIQCIAKTEMQRLVAHTRDKCSYSTFF